MMECKQCDLGSVRLHCCLQSACLSFGSLLDVFGFGESGATTGADVLLDEGLVAVRLDIEVEEDDDDGI